MCGIVGILSQQAEAPIRGNLKAMVQAQFHRGPDDGGTVVLPFGRGRLGLGHRRLSILDLSAAGHQPMVHPDTGDRLVFNGEIYNFRVLRDELRSQGVRFRGQSDTEVLLHALAVWGVEAFPRLLGMYALAWHSVHDGRLVLARDPLGIKPLYCARQAGGLMFASEVRAILASGLVEPRIDRRGLANMLAYGAVQHPLTLFEGIESFPPGCYQIFEPDRTASPVRFWQCPAPEPRRSAAATVAAIRETLEASVRDHLVADVPVGVFLSSGLDSTVVAGLAGKFTKSLRSFTVGFTDQPDMSEFAAAAETAARFGLEHTEVSLSGDEAEQATVAWLGSLDQPSIDGLNTYVIAQAVREQGITVALAGLGGDELFGGYPSFTQVPRLHRALWPLRKLPGPLRTAVGRLATTGRSEAVRQKFQDMLATDGSLPALYLQRRRVLSDELLTGLGIEATALGLDQNVLPGGAFEGLTLAGRPPVWAVSQLESRFYQGNTLLRDSDANGMAHGLEIRVPLLDLRLVELMGTVPDALRLPEGRADKPLLREAFAPLLRPALLEQGKRGFTLPIRRWMAGPLREHCEDALARLKSAGLLRPEGVDRIWSAFLADPESPLWSRAWALVVLGSYLGELPAAAGGQP
jgi:asparagine synthase (glutamine-hydrolysing)